MYDMIILKKESFQILIFSVGKSSKAPTRKIAYFSSFYLACIVIICLTSNRNYAMHITNLYDQY